MVLAQREDARYGLTCEEDRMATFRQYEVSDGGEWPVLEDGPLLRILIAFQDGCDGSKGWTI
jgi:hypothetical protein